MTKLEIREAPRLPRDDRVALFQFEDDPWDVDYLDWSWREPDLSFGGYVDERPVSHVGLLFHPLDLGDRKVLVAGISSVITLPDARGNGYARQLMNAAVKEMRDRSADFGALFCSEKLRPFYASQGWQLSVHPVIVAQSTGKISSPIQIMILPLSDATWPDGPVDLQSEPW